MRNTAKMINSGSEAMGRNKAMNLTAVEVKAIKDASEEDVYLFGEKMFYVGVALGMKLAERESKS